MSRKVIVYIATSLDGYIATEEDSLDWLFKVEGEGDNGYKEFYDTVDTIILGRRTYDWIMEVEQDNFPYKNKKCYVFTRSSYEPNENVEFIDNDMAEFIDSIKRDEGKNIWIVGGGNLISYLLKENLIDEFIITIAPTIIGSGIPLFSKHDNEIELELKSIRRFNQFAELHYVRKSDVLKEKDKSYKFTSMKYLDKEDLMDAVVYKETEDSVLLYKSNNEQYTVYWGANNKESLITVLSQFIKDKCDKDTYIEFIPEAYIEALVELDFSIVSEYKDFWKKNFSEEKTHISDKLNIRPMRSEESLLVSDVTKSCAGYSRGFEGESTENIRKWISNENSQVFVVEKDSRIVGACMTKIYGEENNTCLWIRLLAVHPDFQRQGIGRSLLNYCLAWGQNQGVSKSFLHSDVKNDNAIQLYLDCGYRTEDSRGQINMKKIVSIGR